MTMTADRKSRLEHRLIAASFRAGLAAPLRQLHRRRAVILMYHGFTTIRARDDIANHEWKHLPADEFEAQLRFLRTHYRVIPLDDLVRGLTAGTRLPPRAAAVTIDDGYRSIYSVAFPILEALGVPATVFLATEFVDGGRYLWTDRVEYAIDRARPGPLEVTLPTERLQFELGDAASRIQADRIIRSAIKRLPQEAIGDAVGAVERSAGRELARDRAAGDIYQPLSWTEIREMAASGLVSFGSHTHSHVILSRCGEDQIASELELSRRIIEDRLGRPCSLFCYPNGRRGDFNEITRRLVKERRYSCALTTVYGSNAATADVYELKRYNFGKRMIRGEADMRLAGLFG
jgi:peptidoglycan/xylan/chitin deacetylase (PgdA/CDA1 family)